ncbi:MAG: recombinase family protein [Armatimonas sp.]
MLSIRPTRTRLATRSKAFRNLEQAPDSPVVYARKSSEADDEQAASHERQLRDLRDVVERDGFDLDAMALYEENKSAKDPGRPLFNEMMARIEAGELNVLYAHEISRLCRNMIDGGRIIHALQQGIIRRIVTEYRTYLPGDNTIIIAIEACVSTEEIRTLKRRVESSLTNKHAKGQYPGKAPIGYMNDLFGIKGDRQILPDPERFEMVQALWRKMLTGAYTVKQLHWESRAQGLTTRRYGKTGGGALTYNSMHAMFCNPFYCGLYQWAEEVHQGSHVPMISVAEFEQVQGLIRRAFQPRPHARKRAAEIVPYMGGLVVCGTCGSAITAETHTKTNKSGGVHHFVYLRCSKKRGTCPERYLSLAEFERQAYAFLETLTLPDSIAEWALQQLREENTDEQRAQEQILSQLRASLERNQAARKRLTDLLIDGLIDKADYEERRLTLVKECQVLAVSLERQTSRSNQWLEDVAGAFSFCRSLKQRFEDGTPQERRILLEIVGSNRRIQGKKLIIQPDELFAAVRSGNENGDWRPLLEYVRTTMEALNGKLSALRNHQQLWSLHYQNPQ